MMKRRIKLTRVGITPLDSLFTGGAVPYSPGSLTKKPSPPPEPPAASPDETAREAEPPASGAATEQPDKK